MGQQKTQNTLAKSYTKKGEGGDSGNHGSKDVDSQTNTASKKLYSNANTRSGVDSEANTASNKMYSDATTRSVEKLHFHLPKEQNSMFHPFDSIHYTVQKTSVNSSMFTMWMERNKTDVRARMLLYSEFPIRYIWKSNKCCWEPRKTGVKFGRIPHVPPSSGDLYYLRIMLNTKRGVKEWDEFKTVNKIVYPTYRDTCYAHGLLEDEKQYIDCLTEARHWGMEEYLCSYYVMPNMCENMSQTDFVGCKSCHLMAPGVQHVEETQKNTQASIEEETFTQLLHKLCYPKIFQERGVLAPTNNLEHILNKDRLPIIPRPVKLNYNFDTISACTANKSLDEWLYPTHLLNNKKKTGLELHLEIGTSLICNRNINQKSGLYIGTKLQVLRLGENIVEAEIMSGEKVGKICAIPRIQITQPDAKMTLKNTRQFPVSKSFDITNNSTQEKH